MTLEPYEDVEIEAPDDCIGSVIESLGLEELSWKTWILWMV